MGFGTVTGGVEVIDEGRGGPPWIVQPGWVLTSAAAVVEDLAVHAWVTGVSGLLKESKVVPPASASFGCGANQGGVAVCVSMV